MVETFIILLAVFIIIFIAIRQSSSSQPTRQREQLSQTYSPQRDETPRPATKVDTRRPNPPMPQITQRMRQQKARTRLVRQLEAPSLALIALVRERAIQLYQEENAVSYSEAMYTILDLEGYNSSHGIDQSLSMQPGADPIVTILLLKAGYEEDALTYFCSSTGSSPEEAQEAIAYLQADIAEGRDLWLFHQARTPEPAIIRFLLQKGHSLIAIRYYRDCTDVSLTIAQSAIKEYEMATS